MMNIENMQTIKRLRKFVKIKQTTPKLLTLSQKYSLFSRGTSLFSSFCLKIHFASLQKCVFLQESFQNSIMFFLQEPSLSKANKMTLLC